MSLLQEFYFGNFHLWMTLDDVSEEEEEEEIELDVDTLELVMDALELEVDELESDEDSLEDISINLSWLLFAIGFDQFIVLELPSLTDTESEYDTPESFYEQLGLEYEEPSHPVADTRLHALPTVQCDAPLLDRLPPLQSDCSICLEKYKLSDRMLFLECNHFFHEHCILPWFRKQNFCPICRHPI